VVGTLFRRFWSILQGRVLLPPSHSSLRFVRALFSFSLWDSAKALGLIRSDTDEVEDATLCEPCPLLVEFISPIEKALASRRYRRLSLDFLLILTDFLFLLLLAFTCLEIQMGYFPVVILVVRFSSVMLLLF
jgi:hypothetical protein